MKFFRFVILFVFSMQTFLSFAESPFEFKPIRICMWGTSSFHGGKSAAYRNTFCGQLQNRVLPHIVMNLSVGGATLPFFEEEKTVEAILAIQPDVVYIMQGSNDVVGGRELDAILSDIREVEKRFSDAGIRTVFSTWQPRKGEKVTPEKLLNLMLLNQWLRNTFADRARLLDVPPTLAFANNPAVIDPLYDRDGTHFNDAGNRAWARNIDLSVLYTFPPVGDSFDGFTGHVLEEKNTQREGQWQKTEGWGYHGDSALLSDQAGASATYSYTGRNFCVWSKRRNDFGIMEIILDGKRIAKVDTYGIHWPKDDGYRATPIYCSAYVEHGNHTVTLKVSGEKNPIAKGAFISVDALEFQQ